MKLSRLASALCMAMVTAYACAPENAVVGGQCAGAACGADGSLIDGNQGDGNSGDGNQSDGNSGDGSQTDGNSGDGSQTDGCIPPFRDDNNCGACGLACVAPNDTCLETSPGVLECKPRCTLPQVACSARCVNTQTDPENCGQCGNVCPTFLCTGGICQGVTPGDIVAIGHDFLQPAGAASQAKILANAVFTGVNGTSRVLSYEQFADATAVSNAKASIAAQSGGRAVSYTVSNQSTDLTSSTLSRDYDAILIYDQSGTNAATLSSIGTGVAASLADYTSKGGTVVILDGGTGEMPAFMSAASLLQISAHTALAQYAPVQVTAPSDSVGNNVLSPYASFSNSATFTTTETPGTNLTYVVREGSAGAGLPVVIHKVIP